MILDCQISDPLVSWLSNCCYFVTVICCLPNVSLYNQTCLFNCEMQVTPLITLIAVLLAISPSLIKVWRDPQPRMITRWVAYAYTCGFLFGWHVHEKASLHFVIPLAIVAIQSLEDAKHYFLLSIGIILKPFDLLKNASLPQNLFLKVLLFEAHFHFIKLPVNCYISLFSCLFNSWAAVDCIMES